MSTRVEAIFGADSDRVWSAIADISTHVEWMGDAEAITFTSPRRTGVGTTFDCETRVGPFRLTDRMEVTEWEPGVAMAIRHVGVVTGEGRFSLEPLGPHRTRFRWDEELWFPWWMGGPLGVVLSRPVLRRVWRANLSRLADRVADLP